MIEWNAENIHIIERPNLNILFIKQTSTFYKISDETRDRLKEQMGQEILEVVDDSTSTELERYTKGRNLDILLLHVANDCNLRCTYCYNQHGSYQSHRMIMEERVAVQAIDLIFSHYTNIGSIQFFGGEPLLNLDVIETVCEYVTKKATAESRRIPQFGLNTNGTIMNDRVINLIHRYKITVSVSLDGGANVHDSNRVNAAGEGSYQQVVDHIRLLKSSTGMPNCIEATFTPEHVKNGVGVMEVVDTIRQTLSFDPIFNLSPMASNPETYPLNRSHWSSYVELIRREFTRLRAGEKPVLPIIINVFLQRLYYQKVSKYLCLSGFYKLAVDAGGNIYPCNGLIGQDQLQIGNVFDSLTVFQENLEKVQHDLSLLQKTVYFAECRHCWMYAVCNYCYIYSLQDGILDIDVLNQHICDFNRMLVEELIVQITICHMDETSWSHLKNYIHAFRENN